MYIRQGLKTFTISVIFLLTLSPGFAQEYRYIPLDAAAVYEEKSIDLLHLQAHIRPDTVIKGVHGKALYTFRPYRANIDTITFYAPGIELSSATINQKKVGFAIKNNNLFIYNLPSPLNPESNSLEIEYISNGPSEPYFIGFDDNTFRMRRQIWAHRPFGWVPYLNDRLTVELYVNFSSSYKVFSNGSRVSEIKNNNGTTTWHYSMPKPHPFFSTALAIGKYEYQQFAAKSGIPLEYWYYPERKESFDATYMYSTEMFDFLENELQVAYPWELYRQAPLAEYLYGAMETTTATVFGDYMHIDQRGWWGRNYVNVNVHELVHQWFGNYISHNPASDVWLTESMATYYAKLFERSLFGEAYYEKDRLQEKQKALNQSETNDYPLAHSQGGVFRWYQKGSLVLEMLRDEMGDEAFRKAITHYLKKFAYSEANSHDLLKAIHESTGLSLNSFFDQWIFGAGEPDFHAELIRKKILDKETGWLTVKQVHKIKPGISYFTVNVPIRIGYSDGTDLIFNAKIHGYSTTIELPGKPGCNIDFVVFDSGNRILKKLQFKRSLDELANSAERSINLADRFEAIKNMRDFDLKTKRETLYRMIDLGEEEFILSEIMQQLKSDTAEETRILVEGFLRHPDAMIRRSAIENYIPKQATDTIHLVHLLEDPDYFNIEFALRKLHAFMPEKSAYWIEKTEHENGFRGNHILIARLELSVKNGEMQKINQLKDLASGSFDFETRLNALQSLDRLGIWDETTIKLLKDASVYFNPKLSGPAREILKKAE
jgi:aminopeptidase N